MNGLLALLLASQLTLVFETDCTSLPPGAIYFEGEVPGAFTDSGFVVEGTTSVGTLPVGIDHQTGFTVRFPGLDSTDMRFDLFVKVRPGYFTLPPGGGEFGVACHFCNAIGCGLPEGCAVDQNSTVRMGYKSIAGGLGYQFRVRDCGVAGCINWHEGPDPIGNEEGRIVKLSVDIIGNLTRGYVDDQPISDWIPNDFPHRQIEIKGVWIEEGWPVNVLYVCAKAYIIENATYVPVPAQSIETWSSVKGMFR